MSALTVRHHSADWFRRRVTAVLTAALVAIALVVAPSPTAAQSADLFVPSGGTVVVFESPSACPPPGGAFSLEVDPPTAGTATLTPGTTCRITFTAGASYRGPASIAAVVNGLRSPLPFTITVLDPALTVVQGNTTDLVPPTTCVPLGTTVGVIPSDAGTIRLGANGCGVRFTASTTYLGPFQPQIGPIGGTGQGTLYVVARPPGFTQPAVSANGSFTPVLPPPPPGPCILLTSNAVVQFGDVTVGGPFENGDVAPTVTGCADPAVNQSVSVRTLDASNGTATLTPGCAGVEPAACTPSAGSFAVALVNTSFTDDFVIGTTNTTWMQGNRGDFGATPAPLALKLPTTVDPAAVGTSFSFNVVFTATTA